MDHIGNGKNEPSGADAELLLRLLLEELSCAVAVLDAEGNVVAASRVAQRAWSEAALRSLRPQQKLRTLGAEQRNAAEYLRLTAGENPMPVRATRRGTWLLLEGMDVSERDRLRGNLQAAETRTEPGQAEIEELRSVAEMSLVAHDELRARAEEQRDTSDRVLQLNLQLQLENIQLARRVEELETMLRRQGRNRDAAKGRAATRKGGRARAARQIGAEA